METVERKIELISPGNLAERLGVSRRTVWRWSKEGRLPKPRKIGEATTRYDLNEVRDWLVEQPYALTAFDER